MAEKKVVTPVGSTTKKVATPKPVGLPLFEKDNFMWMGIGAVVIAIGMLLMAGGKNEDPNTFNVDSVYSTMRITVAPILIIIGLLIEVYAIFKKPKVQH